MTVTRPLLRWLGGKFRLGPWIISHFPPHRIYVEPYGGAASVLFQKPRVYNEIYSDMDGELVNLFRVLRDQQQAQQLRHLLTLTPYARDEYWAAFEPVEEPVERARRMIVRSHMAHGTGGARIDRPTGFRTLGVSGSTNVAGEWATFPLALDAIVDRIRGVEIDNRPAIDLVRRYDAEGVLIYLDPPYLPAVRSVKSRKPGERYHTYQFEMTDADHAELLDCAAESKAMIVLSGYPDDRYDAALPGWTRRQIGARAHRNSPRTEVIWINPRAAAALPPAEFFETMRAS